MSEPEAITSFIGPYRFLSNFYPSPLVYQGLMFPTVEHAYQSAKTMDPWIRREFTLIRLPAAAKRYGSRIKVRTDWEDVKLSIMLELLMKKFRDPRLAGLLLDTGHAELIEGNDWGDTFWGVCKGKGTNHLGNQLMLIRTTIRGNTQ